LDAGSNAATVLLEDDRFDFDAPNRYTYHHRIIFKVWTKNGAQEWSTVQQSWAPWQEERPKVRARVITPDGIAHELDQKTVADSPARDNDSAIFTDRRVIRAPLPALEPGSIVEQEIVTTHSGISPEAGVAFYFRFGEEVPVERTTLRLRGPETIAFRFKARMLPDVAVKDHCESSVREIVFEQGPMKPWHDIPPMLPPDEPRLPHVEFATGKDWSAAAAAYNTVVERQIQGFNAVTHLPKLAQSESREDKILAILGKLNREIRYTGVEFSEASVVPRSPAEVLERRYGDCKDKSALAVALLRSAGIDAYIALLYSSTGEDIEQDLPGLDLFNHAIVYVPGKPDLWLDPTDTDLRLGVVSPANQGRYALIARAENGGLVKTPELGAQDNRILETREFQLAELGPAKVTETSEVFGTVDREYRAEFGAQSEKELHDSLKTYVEWMYSDAKITNVSAGDASDLTRPFKLKIDVADAQRGTSGRTEAAVAIFLAPITQRLPQYFAHAPAQDKEKGNDEVKPAPRTQDFFLREPFTAEWRYIIHAPPGFRIRQLPEGKQDHLGPAILTTSYSRESDTTVVADVRFATPKRRFSAAEGTELRSAVVELNRDKPILIYFDQIGETDLASGKVKEALAEFAALRKLHPGEALHVLQTSRALLEAGAGEAARAEARRAVAMEPSSAPAYVQLAEILKNDLIGRPMQKGFDADGAAAAYRKALELNPNDDETRANLAILLEYNRLGVRYGEGSKLEEAIAEYKKIEDKLAGLGVPQNYAIALLRAGRYQELLAYLDKQPDNATNQALRICAQALLNGAGAGIRAAAQSSGVEAKQQALAAAGQTLIILRHYGVAADLLEAASAGGQNSGQAEGVVQMLRRTKRLDGSAIRVQEPEDAIRAFFALAVYRPDDTAAFSKLISTFSTEMRRDVTAADFNRGMHQGTAPAEKAGMTIETALDLGQAAVEYSRDGNDETGWVVRGAFPAPGLGKAQNQVWFVVKEEGTYRLLAGLGEFAGVGRLVLKQIDGGQLDQAKIWLDRVREQLAPGGGDDPLSGPLFSRIWRQQQPANPNAMRQAAATLLVAHADEAGTVISILEAARTGVDASATNAITCVLAEAYVDGRQFHKAFDTMEPLMKAVPEASFAFTIALQAAYALSVKDGRKLLDTNAGRFKSNPMALRFFAGIALSAGDIERSNAIERELIDSGRGENSDYNQIAWADLMAGTVTAATLELANKGMLMGGNGSTALMHTLAAVQAELGKGAEARAMLLQRLKASGSTEPVEDDWYVFGRIAEQYGLTQEAVSMYRKVGKPHNEPGIAASTYTLAQRRIDAINAAGAAQVSTR
jgi:transglutaminase-like putative cysteine protease/tetratricopeptide (TPR) repeat protein